MPVKFGGKADTRVWDGIVARVKQLGKFELKAGIVEQKQHEGSDLTIGELGAIHEYGAPEVGIEPRPWLSFTLQDRKKDIADLMRKMSEQVLAGVTPPLNALATLGTFVSTAMKRSIAQRLIRQQLAASTLKKRGEGAAALLDTEQLYNAIGYKLDRRR